MFDFKVKQINSDTTHAVMDFNGTQYVIFFATNNAKYESIMIVSAVINTTDMVAQTVLYFPTYPSVNIC